MLDEKEREITKPKPKKFERPSHHRAAQTFFSRATKRLLVTLNFREINNKKNNPSKVTVVFLTLL